MAVDALTRDEKFEGIRCPGELEIGPGTSVAGES
jgi:hypothetical protein